MKIPTSVGLITLTLVVSLAYSDWRVYDSTNSPLKFPEYCGSGPDSSVYFFSSSNLYRFKDGLFEQVQISGVDSIPRGWSTAVPSDGSIWLGLYRFEPKIGHIVQNNNEIRYYSGGGSNCIQGQQNWLLGVDADQRIVVRMDSLMGGWYHSTKSLARVNDTTCHPMNIRAISGIRESGISCYTSDITGNEWFVTSCYSDMPCYNNGGLYQVINDSLVLVLNARWQSANALCAYDSLALIGTEMGLLVYNKNKITVDTVIHEEIRALFVDSKGRCWISIAGSNPRVVAARANDTTLMQAGIMPSKISEDNLGRIWMNRSVRSITCYIENQAGISGKRAIGIKPVILKKQRRIMPNGRIIDERTGVSSKIKKNAGNVILEIP